MSLRLCQRLLGLMTPTLVVVPMGRLHMRGMQCWVTSHRLNPHHHVSHSVRVSKACTTALNPKRKVDFLNQAVPMGVVLCRKVVTTDASL